MNAEMRARHMEMIRDPVAAAMYDDLCAQCDVRAGGMDAAQQSIISDIALLEQTKRALISDVNQRGAVEDFRNGRQKLKRENKSVREARMLMEQQRKHLSELRLTPGSQRKSAAVVADEEPDDFDTFDE
ncbi:MAG: hypothetical protein RSD95_10400 [Clostridia bacterium]